MQRIQFKQEIVVFSSPPQQIKGKIGENPISVDIPNNMKVFILNES